MNFNLSNLVAGCLFGLIGYAGWRYGRAVSSPRKLLISAALMMYPYLVANDYALWGIGGALTLALIFVPNE